METIKKIKRIVFILFVLFFSIWVILYSCSNIEYHKFYFCIAVSMFFLVLLIPIEFYEIKKIYKKIRKKEEELKEVEQTRNFF